LNDMDNDKINSVNLKSAVAIVEDDNRLKAVELIKRDGFLKIHWTRSSEAYETDWKRFVYECGLPIEQAVLPDIESDRKIVVGFNTAGTIFNRTTVPAVEEGEIESIIELQAETRLPLPAEQIEMDWRADKLDDGQLGVTIAVARKEQLQRFVNDVKSFHPSKILLNCEGLVKAWGLLFSGEKQKAIILSCGSHNMQVCLVEAGRLSNAVVLDIGLDDFSAVGPEEQTEATERFAQDMMSVLDLFGCAEKEKKELPVFVLSDGSPTYVSIVSSLRLAGLNARLSSPEIGVLAANSGLSTQTAYEYRTAIGLALMALETGSNELNIFKNLYTPVQKVAKKHWLYSTKVTCAIAAVMLVLLVMVSYAVDIAGPKSIEKRIESSISNVDMDLLVKRHQMIRAIARERPDLLELLKIVNESGEQGITLTGLSFKKGQPVSVSGEVSSNDQLSRYEKKLQETKGIDNVNYTANVNTKNRKITFTMTFQYKNFGKKAAKTKS
jgi:hypothetical protein